MKRYFILLIFCIFVSEIQAQRQSDSWALQGSFGIMGRSGSFLNNDMATQYTFGGTRMLGSYFVEANVFMQDFGVKHYQLQNHIPFRVYGINALGGWSYEGWFPVMFNFKAGGLAGYQFVNKESDRDSEFNTKLSNEIKGFTYSVVGSIEGELNLVHGLNFTLAYNQYYYPTNKWIRWQFAANAGLKYYF
jgi:hypothetical protein